MGRDVIHPHIRWLVGHGRKNININKDKWLSIGVIDGLANRGDSQIVADLINQNTRGLNE